MIYFHKEDCAAIKKLKAYFASNTSVEALFLKRIPEDFLESFSPKENTAIVFDDLHSDAISNREIGNLLYEISSVWVHHHNLYVFFCVQAFDIVKKQSKLHNVFLNSTHVVFFKTAHDARSIRRYLGNYEISLKSSGDLWQIFQKYVQKKSYAYLIICVSPRCEKQTVYSNILIREEGAMLSFHESSDEED